MVLRQRPRLYHGVILATQAVFLVGAVFAALNRRYFRREEEKGIGKETIKDHPMNIGSDFMLEKGLVSAR